MKRGIFVVFEGTAKCGKKTQSRLLADALTQITGKETLFIHFPDKSTSVGKVIERYHSGELNIDPRAAHLLYTANRWERQSDIADALSAGTNVVVDRYSYSGIAYTAARFNPLSTADWTWCRSAESGLLQPNLIFFLAPENFPEIAVREGFGERPYETQSFQLRVLANYARLSREMEAELCEETNGVPDAGTSKPILWNWIQATGQTVDDMHMCVMTIIDPLL